MSYLAASSQRSQVPRYIIPVMIIQPSLERINAQLEESSFRFQRSCVIINFIDFLPRVGFRYQTMSRTIRHQMLENSLQESPSFIVFNVSNFLFGFAQIWFHVDTNTFFRHVCVKMNQILQNVFVKSNALSAFINFFE